jgi:serine-type D-Ala-D-Ala carboxypeptidase/endopeptidase (penicillin-binding protein 4)
MGLRGRLTAAGGIVVLLAPAAAFASAPPNESAAIAVDLATGQIFLSHNADVALEPASNEKLMITYGALTELGPDYRFRTVVLGDGRQVGRVWQGRLVLKGYGDPTLQTDDLRRLAKKLYARGIRAVTGHVAGDASWFDRRWTAPGWLPTFYGDESAPLSALVVNRAWRGPQLARDPALAAAALFDQMLRAQGIEARDAVVGRARANTTELASVRSHKLSVLLRLMNADSDNFTAEMVLKAIGAEGAGIGSTATGASIVRRDLAAAGVPLSGARIVDGSGLSRLDRVTARALSSLLLVFWKSSSLRTIVTSSLAVAGETGTLKHRLLGKKTRGIVRGKTGTTQISSALSGYVGSRYAFVLIQNGHPVDWDAAHKLQDRFVEKLARLSRREALSVHSR